MNKSKLLLFTLLGVAIGIGLYYWIRDAIQWVPLPEQLEYGEPYVLLNAWKWGIGVPQWSLESNFGQMYTPLYFILAAPLVKIFGMQLWPLRLLEILATIGCLVFIFLIIRRMTGKPWAGAIAALLPFLHPVVRQWSILVRVDILAIMFELAGVYVFMKYEGTKKVWWSLPLLLAGFFTKQSTVAGIVAVCLWLLIKNRHLFWKYAGVALVVVVFGTLTLFRFTLGPDWTSRLYEFQITGGLSSIIGTQSRPGLFMMISGNIYWPMIFPFLLAIYYVVRRWRISQWSAVWMFWIVTAAVEIMAIVADGGTLTGGSYTRHLEFVFITCLVGGLCLARWFDMKKGISALAIGIVAIQLTIVCTAPTIFPWPDNDYLARCQKAEAIITDSPARVLGENSMLVINAGTTNYGDPFGLTVLADTYGYNEVTDLANKRIEYVITNNPLPSYFSMVQKRYGPEAQYWILKNYHLVYLDNRKSSCDWFNIYVYEANK